MIDLAHVQKATIAPHEMAAMVGIGRERRAAMTDLKDSTIWWRRRRRRRRAEGWPQGASTPLQKNLPRATVMRAEPPLMVLVIVTDER